MNALSPVRYAKWIVDLTSGNRHNYPSSEERLALVDSSQKNGCGVSDKSTQGSARAARRDI